MHYEKIKIFFVGIFASLLTGCGQERDPVSQAYELTTIIQCKYAAMFAYPEDHERVLEQARLVSHEQSMSFGSGVWAYLTGDDHLIFSSGTPLHRAVYFMQQDIQALEGVRRKLERRGLYHEPVYKKIEQFVYYLYQAVRIVQASSAYTKEAQFIEGRQLSKAQLHEQRKQTALLQDIKRKPSFRDEHHHYYVDKASVNVIEVVDQRNDYRLVNIFE